MPSTRSAVALLEVLWQDELNDPGYDPEVVALVREHLGASTLHAQAGERLAEALLQLARARAEGTR